MRFAIAASLCVLLASAPASRAEGDKPDFSPAERLLFMTPQLQTLQPPTLLRYTFSKTGSLEDPFGHQWHIATPVEDVPPDEMAKRAQSAMKQEDGG